MSHDPGRARHGMTVMQGKAMFDYLYVDHSRAMQAQRAASA